LAKFKVYKIALQRTKDLWQKKRAFFFNKVFVLQDKTKSVGKIIEDKALFIYNATTFKKQK